jgi:hypothetical protein
MADVAQALTDSLTRNGAAAATGNQNMGGFRHLNVADAQAANEYATTGQVQNGSIVRCINEVNVGDNYSAQLPFGVTSFANGQMIVIKFPATNTGTTPTLNLNSTIALPILREDGSVIVVGDCRANVPSRLMFNNTSWLLLGAVVAASSVAGVTTFNGRAGAVTLITADVVNALGYTPVNKAGDTMTGRLTLSGDAVNALHAVTFQQLLAQIAAIPSGGVTSWNGRTGAVTLTGTDVVTALTYTPANAAGPFKPADGAVGAPAYSWASDAVTGFFKSVASRIDFASNSVLRMVFGARIGMHPTQFVSWAPDGTLGSWDIGLTRNAAGVVEVNDGNTAGVLRDLKARYATATAFTQVGQYGVPATTVDYNAGQHQYYPQTGNVTLNVTNIPIGSMLRLIVSGTNTGTITWTSTLPIWWPGGSIPSLVTGPQKFAMISFVNVSGGAYMANVAAY